jgi:hypothetical protein
VGMPPEPAVPPNQILTADNILDTTELSPLLIDTVERFKALWGK